MIQQMNIKQIQLVLILINKLSSEAFSLAGPSLASTNQINNNNSNLFNVFNNNNNNQIHNSSSPFDESLKPNQTSQPLGPPGFVNNNPTSQGLPSLNGWLNNFMDNNNNNNNNSTNNNSY